MKIKILQFINRLLRYETMSGNYICPVYLERWTLLLAFNCGGKFRKAC